MKIRTLTAALLGTAALFGAAAPIQAQDKAATSVAAAEPAVPNTPRQVTPASMAAPPLGSPDASQIDASDGKTDPLAADAPAAATDNDDSIVATVNDESISDYELRQRVAMVVATTPGLQGNAEALKRIRAQALEKLEEEKIQLQEAVKKHITVSPAEVDKSINRMLTGNHITIEQLRTILTNAGASEAAMRSQITAQIAWQKAVQDEYSDQVNITPAQVDAELRRFTEGASKPHYVVAEIFLAVDNPNQDAKVQKDAQNLETQLQAGAQFSALARQFSQNPTAAGGGEMGMVREGQLAPELDSVLRTMKPGAISDPIRSVGGYYILQLHLRQEPVGTHIEDAPTAAADPKGSLPLARLLLPLGPSPSKENIEAGMKIAGQIRSVYNGCETLAKMPAKLPGAVYMSLGQTKLSDLSPEIQKALADSHPGEMATPMLSEAGVEMIGRCDAKVEVRTAYTIPSRDEVQNELFDEQISALARRYLRDLKRDADVEIR